MGRRQSSRRWSTRFSDLASLSEDGSSRSFKPSAQAKRMSSWMMDEDIQKFLNDVDDEDEQKKASLATGGTFEDTEVLEQYRLMAHFEAYERVKENIGFDIEVYEERKKMDGDKPVDKKWLYGGGKKPETLLPDVSEFDSSQDTTQMDEPPPPVPTFKSKWLKQKQSRVPELCPGAVIHETESIPHDESIVRCLGCKVQLRVKTLATLVSCPNCKTVSPASTTRR